MLLQANDAGSPEERDGGLSMATHQQEEAKELFVSAFLPGVTQLILLISTKCLGGNCSFVVKYKQSFIEFNHLIRDALIDNQTGRVQTWF